MPDPIQFLSVRPGRGKVADDFRRPARFGKNPLATKWPISPLTRGAKKELLKMAVKYWFIRKAFDGQQKQDAMLFEPKIIKKSEKGVLLEWDIPGRGSFRSWAPLSAVEP